MRNLRGVRDTSMVDEAIESAAEYITKKEERRHKKHSCCEKTAPPSIPTTRQKEEKKKERKISFPPMSKKEEKKERKISAWDKTPNIYAGKGLVIIRGQPGKRCTTPKCHTLPKCHTSLPKCHRQHVTPF